MRQNAIDIRKSPEASIIPSRDGDYLKLSYPSWQVCHAAAKRYARTANESEWISNGYWLGLGGQPVSEFERTGVADESLAAVRNAAARMPTPHAKPDKPHAAITGGFWDTASVVAGLPLAARMRRREKLPPITLKLAISLSASVAAEEMARYTVKLARAIWNYTIAGGAVTLNIASFGDVKRAPYVGVMVDVKVNAADVATLATVLSPAFDRGIGGAFQAAASGVDHDSLTVPRDCPVPGYIYLGGRGRDVFTAAEAALTQLKITEE